jgi:hypothetical protein
LLCGLFVVALSLAGLAHAQAIEVHNTLISKGLPSDTGNGSSSTAALSSADGRYVVFTSLGANFVPGIVDANSTTDVFLHDRATQKTVLVSRSVVSATTTASGDSRATAISADGEWVLFQSSANNLVFGVTDNNAGADVFLYQRSTGAVSLVSRSNTSATTTANSLSLPTAISADGERVLFVSVATDLVAGVADSNGSEDVFLYQRSTGAVSLVSRSAAAATVTANNQSFPVAVSNDGEWVLLQSRATNLVSGVTDSNFGNDVFLYQRSTGVVTLVSRSAASATTTANGVSEPRAISADGEWVLFRSFANDLVVGLADSNDSGDVFLYQRSTGAVRLVSRSAASATTAANSESLPTAISADGEWVLFRSNATNLVAGVTDSNNFNADVFLYQRSTGTVSLVSRSAASATTTANGLSFATAMSADGEWVLFGSGATNPVAGVSDTNASDDLFLYQRSTGAVSLVSRSAASATMTANNGVFQSTITPDGEWVLFVSVATNLVSNLSDSNDASDVFLYQRSAAAVSLVSRSNASPPLTANRSSTPTAISTDGEWVLLQSKATDLVSGVTDIHGFTDVFLYQPSTGAMSLVSRSAASATTTGSGESFATAISADGEWVLFQSYASNLVSGVTDGNVSEDVFLHQRSTGAVSLVSRSAASATTTANNQSAATAISADGEWVLFRSLGTNLVSGVTDDNGTLDVFLYQRSTGAVSLISRSAASATTTADNASRPIAISADGAYVLFQSAAGNLVSGVTDSNGTSPDVFLYERSTGAVSLVSRSGASAMTTANGASFPAAISADGEWVLFQSNATNLVSGVSDGSNTVDVFLYQRSTGTVSLVSRSAASATTTANNSSVAYALSADGEWVLFSSDATNLVPGVTDSNNTDDAFLFQRSTGTVSLISHLAASTTTANGNSEPTAISADGEWVLFRSTATNLVPGITDANGPAYDVFLYQRSTGAASLVSRSAESAAITANVAAFATAMSTDGARVLFASDATNLVAGVLDSNDNTDVFLANIVDPNRVFADGFESAPPGTSPPPDGP